MADGTPLPAATSYVLDPAQSANVDLRPLTTSELIDRGFTLYRSHFAGFLLLALLSQIAPLLCQIFGTSLKLNPLNPEILRDMDHPLRIFTRVGIYLGLSLLAQIIVFCFEVVIAFYIADAYLGKVPSVIKSLRQFSTRIASSIWTCLLNRILIGLTLLFPFLALVAINFYLAFYPAQDFMAILLIGFLGLLLIVASLVPLLIVFMRLMVTVPAVALEGLSGWKAVRRSFALVRYDPGLGILYWGEMRLSFLLLPLFVIELLLLSLASLPLFLHQMNETVRHGSMGQDLAPPDSIVIFSQILIFLAGAFILPLYSIASTLFYYDIRIRREGFDLEFMAQKLEGQK